MSRTMQDYLNSCLAEYGDVTKAKYGRAFDLLAIEREVRNLQSKKTLSYTDLQFFEAPGHWWFEKFWIFPPEHKVATALQERTFGFLNLPKKEEILIPELLEVFKSIELVSIILRFIKPEHYGILSPPVERVLNVRRGNNAVATYSYYLHDLRHIKKSFGFKRTADADMALWVLHEKCFGQRCDPDIERAYRDDPTFRGIIVNNLILPIAQLPSSKLAGALCRLQEKRDIAALIACHTFESLIREMGKLLFRDPPRDLEPIIKRLADSGQIDREREAAWKRLKSVRNQFFHQDVLPTRDETSDLIKEVDWIERGLERLKQTGDKYPNCRKPTLGNIN